MTESNNMSKPTVAETLLEACREIASTGQTVKRATLMNMHPNHSARDYQKALELYADECRKVRDCPVPMPDEMLERINNIIKSLWADIVGSSGKRIARIRDESQKTYHRSLVRSRQGDRRHGKTEGTDESKRSGNRPTGQLY